MTTLRSTKRKFPLERTLSVLTTKLATLMAARLGPIAMDALQICLRFLSASQPMDAYAFIVDGSHYGVSDFPYAAYSMTFVGV
ncbi:hypothetical protein CTI12_AA142210 [Artemisia annua]|uniref:Uncharacterized protein n=1 Tax=Artemisia annua TaxID=35608 RepID=A0A2U1PKE7_ARTAN|nr:hypothetical protein CTI12_AA142210 [Artemisia annua]